MLTSIGSDPWYHLLTQLSMGWRDYKAVHPDPAGINPAPWMLYRDHATERPKLLLLTARFSMCCGAEPLVKVWLEVQHRYGFSSLFQMCCVSTRLHSTTSHCTAQYQHILRRPTWQELPVLLQQLR